MAWSILRCDEVDSTNNVCKTLAAQGADNTAVIARRQTAGKGRLGRSFRSPEGGLYLSVLWRGCPAGQLLTVTPLAAVAVCRAIEQTCGAVCGIKWCNDVVLNGKKLCGILTESSLSYLGFGISIPNPSWGGMLEGAQTYILTHPSLAVYPGVCILLTVLCFNVLGNGFRRRFSPNSGR